GVAGWTACTIIVHPTCESQRIVKNLSNFFEKSGVRAKKIVKNMLIGDLRALSGADGTEKDPAETAGSLYNL
ncbi:MAG: hypothetical protein IJO82_05190, partial [Clostridia bacterium]|nr:hypothetical protein [Clostridia bacterium]